MVLRSFLWGTPPSFCREAKPSGKTCNPYCAKGHSQEYGTGCPDLRTCADRSGKSCGRFRGRRYYIPKDQIEDLSIVVSVFIHPEAKDYNKIYRYNYGATKLAIERAMEGFPDVKTLMYEKDRTMHPIMGFKVVRLWNPPYLQVAFDMPDIDAVKNILKQIPQSDHLIIEAGTPLIRDMA